MTAARRGWRHQQESTRAEAEEVDNRKIQTQTHGKEDKQWMDPD
jgi:hypothetical protein